MLGLFYHMDKKIYSALSNSDDGEGTFKTVTYFKVYILIALYRRHDYRW